MACHSISRRSILKATSLLLASTALPSVRLCRRSPEERRPPDRRRRFRAAQPEPGDRRLERRLLRRQQGHRAARRSLVRGEDGLDARLATVMGRLGRRPHRHLQAARGRDMARRQAVHLRRRRLLRAAGVEAAAESRPRRVQGPRGGRYAGRPHRGLPLRQADAVPAHPQRAAGADQRGAEASLRRHRHRRQPGQQRSPSAPARSSSPSTRPGEFYRLERNAELLGQGPAPSRRDRLPRAARPRGGGGRARGRARSTSPPSRPCRWPTSTASARSTGHRGDHQGLRGAYLSARRRDQPSPQGARRRQGPAGDRPCDRQGLCRQDDLPRLRRARRPGRCRATTQQFYTADVPAYAVRRRQGQRAARRGRLQARRRRHALRAEAAAGALFQRDEAVRRLSAAGAGRRSASTPSSSTTTRPAT